MLKGLAQRCSVNLISNASLAQRINDAADERINDHPNIQRMGVFSPEDVFIAGFPKSGNTWFQNLAAGAVYGVVSPYNTDLLIQELIPDVSYKKYYKRYSPVMFFKTHESPAPHMRKVVLLLRDGRDVMVSFFHHHEALNQQPVDFLEMIKQEHSFHPCDWHEHVEAWAANPFGAEILTVRYEELRADTVRELQRFCRFIGLERDLDFLGRVVEAASFETARQRERTFGLDHPRWPKSRSFVRRGVVGSHRDEMPPLVLEAFLERSRAALLKAGYTA
jgi:hypothetical protein